MNLPAIVEKYRSEIDHELRAILDSRKSPLYDMMRYHLGWVNEQGIQVFNHSGKALRPSLCLFACEATGGDYLQALPAAAAIELVHNFSLIHDDIQDDDRERRHRPTVWAIWGKPQAINAGTAMRILATSALGRLQARGVTVQKQMWVTRRLDEISLSLIEGQYMDIDFENRFDIRVDDYLQMVSGKTAALLSGSLEVGSYLGTDNEDIVNGFKEAGYNLGLAFQIKDDLLGIWGDEKETGKPAGNDILRKKKSFPIVYALENTEGDLRNELVSFYSNGLISERNIDRVLEIFDRADVRRKSQDIVSKYCSIARHIFDTLNLERPFRDDVDELMVFLTGRTF